MRNKLVGVLYGLVFLAIGVAVMGNILGLWQVEIFFAGWWAMIIIIPALFEIIRSGFSFGSLFLLGVGSILLLIAQNVIQRDLLWQVFAAFILVFVGLRIVVHSFFKKNSVKIKKQEIYDSESIHVTFGEVNPSFDNREFKGLSINATFAGGTIDLTNAIIENDCTINFHVAFGGLEIIVPKDVNVQVNGHAIFGGIENKLYAKPSIDHFKTITLEGSCVFGGVEIK